MYRYTIRDVHCYLWLKEKMLQDVSAASLVLYAQNFASELEKNVVPKFTNRLSLALHKICKYKGFLSPTISSIWIESKGIYGKIRIRENTYTPIFYPV